MGTRARPRQTRKVTHIMWSFEGRLEHVLRDTPIWSRLGGYTVEAFRVVGTSS